MDEARNKFKKSWKDFLYWVLALSLSKPNIEEKSLRMAVERLREKKQVMNKHQKSQAIEKLLEEEFCTAKKKIICH